MARGRKAAVNAAVKVEETSEAKVTKGKDVGGVSEGTIVTLDIPIRFNDIGEYELIEKGVNFANTIFPDFYFAGDGLVLVTLELRKIKVGKD